MRNVLNFIRIPCKHLQKEKNQKKKSLIWLVVELCSSSLTLSAKAAEKNSVRKVIRKIFNNQVF